MTKTVTLYVRVTPELHDALKERADNEQTSMATVIRQALDYYLNQKNNTINYSNPTKNDTSNFQDFIELYQLFKDLQG